jgi:drug/metabolite transporter (DMT)-like permease
MGYAVGGNLTRRLGSLAVISGALVLSLPVSAVATSMFVGFLFWYRGQALGGAARVGQLQLLQTFAGLGLAALLLAEPVGWSAWLVAAGLALSVLAARRTA